MSLTFEAATAVVPEDQDVYTVDLRQEYAIGGNRPNGGYLLACLARAALSSAAAAGVSHALVVAAGGHYISSPEVGPARIEVEILRVGRSVSQARARLVQNGRAGMDAKFILGSLSGGADPYWQDGGAPELPPIEACDAPFELGLDRGLEVRFDPGTSVHLASDGPVATGRGELRAWVTGDAVTAGALGLLYVCDALPPTTFGILATGWVPTLDLSVYVRALPEPGPLRVRFRTRLVQDGFADEVGEAWDSAGRLVMQSTQLMAVRMPPDGSGARA
jgi:hypothetical protein